MTVHKSAETIQGRKLFKGGNYLREYGIQIEHSATATAVRFFSVKSRYWQSYSKLSIIRSGHSRLLEFEKKDSTGRLKDTFSKYPEHVI